jgi:hypothetical protein
MVIRAVVKNGVLHPLDPLPPEWTEGETVELTGDVERPDDPQVIDQWYQELEALIAQTPHDPEDDQRIDEELAEQKRRSKEYMRRQMGLD